MQTKNKTPKQHLPTAREFLAGSVAQLGNKMDDISMKIKLIYSHKMIRRPASALEITEMFKNRMKDPLEFPEMKSLKERYIYESEEGDETIRNDIIYANNMALQYIDTMEELFLKNIQILKRDIEMTNHNMEISRKKKQTYIAKTKKQDASETSREISVLEKVRTMPDDIIRVIASFVFTSNMKICVKRFKFENLEEAFKQIYSNHASVFIRRFANKNGDIVSKLIRQMPVLSTYRPTCYITRNHKKKGFISIFKREMENLHQLRNTLDRMNIPTYKTQLENHILKTYHLLEYLFKNFSISKKRRENRQAKLIAARQSITENA
jgi:hypothetical protein